VHNRVGELSTLAHVEEPTQLLHSRALEKFEFWLDVSGSGLHLSSLVTAPLICDLVVAAYGKHLFSSDAPLYTYLMLITGLVRLHTYLKPHMSTAWTVASNWRIKEPVTHRLPLPLALAKALFACSYLMGFHQFCGCAMLAFFGPGRIGEVLRCTRKCLVLPSDLLFEPANMTLLQFDAPKSRFRGGARIQHLSIRNSYVSDALESIFSSLNPDDPLYPFSTSTFRSRWDRVMGRLGVPKAMFTPGGLRGGGAVASYFEGASIQDLLWKMRIKHMATLESYLQEVSAAVSLNSVSIHARQRISLFSSCYDKLFA